MVKKLFFAAVVAAFGMTACQKTEGLDAAQGGVQTFTVSTSLPAQMQQTRVAGDGLTVNRCIMEVYLDGVQYGERQVVAVDNLTANFSVRLVAGKSYDFVFWADKHGTALEDDLHYNTASLEAVTLNGAYMGNNDEFDAFFASEKVTAEATKAINVELRRPFGQLNVKTLDMKEVADAASALVPKKVSVKFDAVPSGINLLTGELLAENVAMEYQAPAELVNNVDNAGELTVDYIFAPKGTEQFLADFTMSFLAEDGATEVAQPYTFNAIPVQRNYRTMVSGNILTKKADVNVVVKPEFEENDILVWDGESVKEVIPVEKEIDGTKQTVYQIAEPAELAWIAQQVNEGNEEVAEKYIELNANVDLGNKTWTPIGNVSRKTADGGFTGTFNGNGKVIYNLKGSSDVDDFGVGLFGVVNGGTITDVEISGGELSAFDCAGAVAGVLLGESTIANCHVSDIAIDAASASGGVAGRAYGSKNTFENCVSTATVTGDGKCGGIVGIASNPGETTITGCVNEGRVYGGEAGVAGIVGYVGATTVAISDCTNNGQVGSASDKFAAGIVGYQQSPEGLTITDCTNEGTITGIGAGGIYGTPGTYQAVVIERCINLGTINGTNRAGGIASRAGAGRIEACENRAAVNANMTDMSAAGGIVGETSHAQIINCKGGDASVKITAQYPGRLLGHVANGALTPEGVETSITIDDENGDDYNGINTIAAMSLYTAWSNINITGGTLHGKPAVDGQASAYIKIHAGAAWDAYEGQTGVWYCRPGGGSWTKEREL